MIFGVDITAKIEYIIITNITITKEESVEVENQELKEKIDAAGRLKVAKRLGMSYYTLTAKMNGYAVFKKREIEACLAAIAEIEQEPPAEVA
jgi:hypothetical protein